MDSAQLGNSDAANALLRKLHAIGFLDDFELADALDTLSRHGPFGDKVDEGCVGVFDILNACFLWDRSGFGRRYWLEKAEDCPDRATRESVDEWRLGKV